MIFSQPDFSIQPTGATVGENSLFACFDRRRVLLDERTLCLPSWDQVQQLIPQGVMPFELAHTDAAVIFSLPPDHKAALPEGKGLIYYEISVFRSLPFDTAALITTSWHLWNWYQQNRFCGSCSHVLVPASSERALRCEHCGRMVFPAISPAVIVAITCGERILLARNASSPFANYALVAGYVEVGETLEHAVKREALEEVGVHLKHLRYLGDQPWGISGSHMFAFHAEADDAEPLKIQKTELSDARWFDRSELTERGHAVSIAFELIERFRRGIL